MTVHFKASNDIKTAMYEDDEGAAFTDDAINYLYHLQHKCPMDISFLMSIPLYSHAIYEKEDIHKFLEIAIYLEDQFEDTENDDEVLNELKDFLSDLIQQCNNALELNLKIITLGD